jgi:subtilisin-like proprotein convertase family protein
LKGSFMNLHRLGAVAAVLAFGSAASGQTFFFNNAGAIPDGGTGAGSFGAPRIMAVSSNVASPIQDVVVTITINHTYIGDLRIRLGYTPAGSPTTTTAFVLNRVGATSVTSFGEDANLDGTYTFVLGATSFQAATSPLFSNDVLATGAYAPVTSNLNNTHTVVEFSDFFRGLSGTGAWTLTFEDGAATDTGAVTSASIALQARPLPCLADFNTDGVVNTADLTFFLGRFGNLCP